jgi:hypothetical protein
MKSNRMVTGVSLAFSAALKSTGEKLKMPTTPSMVSSETVFDRVRKVSFMIVSFQGFLPR